MAESGAPDVTPLKPAVLRTFNALAHAAFPHGEIWTGQVDITALNKHLNLTLSAMPKWSRRGLLFIRLIFEWSSILRYVKPYSRLSLSQRISWLTKWIDSPLALFRSVARALLTLVKPSLLADRSAQQAIGMETDRLKTVEPNQPIPLKPSQHVDRIEHDHTVRAQVVVIGTGAGGGVVACELAMRGIDVIMIEAGRNFDPKTFGSNVNDHLRETYWYGGSTVALGRPGIPIPLGRTVGGTTTINSGTCFRTPDRILEQWKHNGALVDLNRLEAAYARVEERISVQPVPPDLLGGSSDVIARGAEALRLKHGPLKRNIRGCGQSAVCAFGCPRNAKQSTNITYIPWALEHGARLYSGFSAERIIIENGRAAGVRARCQDTGKELIVRADTVVTACGTIGTVPFLLGSGIKNRHLGRHLSIHPATKIAALMPDVVDGWRDTPQGYGIYELFDEGIMFEGAFVPPEFASIAFPFAGRAFTDVMEQYRRMALFGLLVSDAPNGRVYRKSDGSPLITYWLGKDDTERIRLGLKMLADVFFAAGAERIYLPIAGRERHDSRRSAQDALHGRLDPWRIELAAFHPLGTARISTRPKEGVVKPSLESWDLPGLYVVDGSIFPSSLGVNPQLTIMAFATMAAEDIGARFTG